MLRPSVWSRSVSYDPPPPATSPTHPSPSPSAGAFGPRPLLVRLSNTAFPRLLLPAPGIVGALIDYQQVDVGAAQNPPSTHPVPAVWASDAKDLDGLSSEEQVEDAMFDEEKDIFLLDHHHYARRVTPSVLSPSATAIAEHPALMVDRLITGGRCVECVVNIQGHVFDYHVRRVFNRFQIRYGATVTKSLLLDAKQTLQLYASNKLLNNHNGDLQFTRHSGKNILPFLCVCVYVFVLIEMDLIEFRSTIVGDSHSNGSLPTAAYTRL